MRGARVGALALLLCAAPAFADNPRKVAIGSGSPKGALLFEVPALPIDYQLLLVRLDEGGSPSRREWIHVGAVPVDVGNRFIVATLPPGQYLFEGISQQSKWVACLQARTLAASVEPGRIGYLGSLDARPTLASIQRNADTSKERVAHYGQWHFFRTGVAAPSVSQRDTEGLARAERFVRERMPKSSVTPTLAALTWRPYLLLGRSERADRCV